MPVKDPERAKEGAGDPIETVTEAIRAGIGGAGVGAVPRGGSGRGGPADEPPGDDEDAAEIRRNARDDPRQGGERR